jgi:hypothetical protein
MPTWVIEGNLARDRRPGYSGERGRVVPQAEVHAWVAETKAFGIRSIICLLAEDQLHLVPPASSRPDFILFAGEVFGSTRTCSRSPSAPIVTERSG